MAIRNWTLARTFNGCTMGGVVFLCSLSHISQPRFIVLSAYMFPVLRPPLMVERFFN
jgi:hypothetical protein